MVRHIDAIYVEGVFRPLEPLAIPEGTRVHLSVEEGSPVDPARRTPRIHSPKLVDPEDAADFVMSVREQRDAGI